jgi:hypothetical protein
MPIASRSSPFTALDGGAWLVDVRTGEEGIELQLTDLCAHYHGRCSRDAAHRQLVEEFGSEELDSMFRLLHECIEGKRGANVHALRVVPVETFGSGPPRLALHWDIRGSPVLKVEVELSEAPQRWLRDTFVLPLLRAAVAARALIPDGATWPPSSVMLPLDLSSPTLPAMLERASRSGAPLAEADGAVVETAAAADGDETGGARSNHDVQAGSSVAALGSQPPPGGQIDADRQRRLEEARARRERIASKHQSSSKKQRT